MKDTAQTHEGAAPLSDGQARDLLRHRTLHLRILATTDIHMQLLGHDYVHDKGVGHNGLAGIATLIREARAEAQLAAMPCLLVDNGDMLQGSALGDAMADLPVGPDHPVVASLNAMGYDAIGVGNHDLDHGLTYLQNVAARTTAPVICSNLVLGAEAAILRSALIEVCERNSDTQPLKIGFVSVIPEQTGVWNKPMLAGQADVLAPRAAVAAAVADLQARGSDIIVLLAHMGIEEDGADDVRALATVPGIDAMVAGHTHRRLPGQDHAGLKNVDVSKGALGPRPAAMPGFNASDLAVLDLRLNRRGDGAWHVADYQTHLRANGPAVHPDPEITALCLPAHNRIRAALSGPVAQTAYTLHNFFSLAMPTPTCALAASAKYRIVEKGLKGTADAELPLLATASAHTAGGRGGPDHFIHIPPGTVYRRALAGLNPYANGICALRVTGADVRSWLEHTVGIYTTLLPHRPDQSLLRADRPTFHFDTIYGLSYAIDPCRPVGRRLTHLSYGGHPVEPHQRFILATTVFRAAGGGGGAQFTGTQLAYRSTTTIAEALQEAMRGDGPTYGPDTRPWSFECPENTRATLQTAPVSAGYFSDIAHLAPDPRPINAQGFLPVCLTL